MSARSPASRRGSIASRRSCARTPRTPRGRLRPTRRGSLLSRGADDGGREATGEPHRHQVTELPPIAVRITEYRAHSLRCPGCGKSTGASLPEEVRASSFGPRLQAAIALLSVRNRISRRGASELCGELFGCDVAVGSVDAIGQRTSSALAEPYAGLREAVKDAPVICVDETGSASSKSRLSSKASSARSDSLAAFVVALAPARPSSSRSLTRRSNRSLVVRVLTAGGITSAICCKDREIRKTVAARAAERSSYCWDGSRTEFSPTLILVPSTTGCAPLSVSLPGRNANTSVN
jgi:hypothetical protein